MHHKCEKKGISTEAHTLKKEKRVCTVVVYTLLPCYQKDIIVIQSITIQLV